MERERERSLGAVAAAGYSSMGVRSGEQEPKNGRSRRLLLLLSLLFFVFFFFFMSFGFRLCGGGFCLLLQELLKVLF